MSQGKEAGIALVVFAGGETDVEVVGGDVVVVVCRMPCAFSWLLCCNRYSKLQLPLPLFRQPRAAR